MDDKQEDIVKTVTGSVVIGRNEGERLLRSLSSIIKVNNRVVYVDSGSIDNSVENAKRKRALIVQLNSKNPFSAARARNEGFQKLCSVFPNVEYIQFIDGDCELIEGWLDTSVAFLEMHPDYAIVAGRRRERFQNNSIYNLLCEIEWNTYLGEVDSCGGDFLIRRSAFQSVLGFNPSIIAGEEPELCYRLRQKGWKIRRIANDMTIHDAEMTHFSQWWNRSKRTGHAYVQGYALHFSEGQAYYRNETFRGWIWGIIVPLTSLFFGLWINTAFFFILCIYPLRLIRLVFKKKKTTETLRQAMVYSIFTIIAAWPQLIGQIQYLVKRLGHKEMMIIEHK